LADECRRHAADRADPIRCGVFSLFLPRAGLDQGLIFLDDAGEQLLEPVRGSRPRETLSKQASAPAHLLSDLTVFEYTPDSLRVTRRIVPVDQVSAHSLAHHRAP